LETDARWAQALHRAGAASLQEIASDS